MLMRSIDVAEPGNTFANTATQSRVLLRLSACQSCVISAIRAGLVFHATNVLHYGRAGTGPVFEGMDLYD
jgi:hypothetical protein